MLSLTIGAIMPDLLRIFFILSRHRIASYIGPKFLPKSLYFLFRTGEILTLKKGSKNLGEALALSLTEMGPVYIKFGQSLSARPDLIGEEIASYLISLQDKLPPFSSPQAITILEQELGLKIDDSFASFDKKPIAAASIAQVHKAKLKDGSIVAVKILRPNIETDYTRDIQLLYSLGRKINYILPKKYERFKAEELVNVFNQSMQLELDLRLEAAALAEMQNNYAESIYIPKIYWDFTSHKILTTEWIDGISIYDKDALIKSGLNLKDISTKLAVMFFNQAFKDGFFHADLHPGNVLITKEGKIALIDFGIMGRLTDKDRLAIAEILYALLQKDYARVAELHIEVGYVPSDTDISLFAQSCRAVCEPLIDRPINNISIGKLLEQLLEMAASFKMQPQHQLFLLQKTIIVLEGIGKSLDPEINMWKLAEPWIKKWAGKNISPEAKVLRLLKGFLKELFKS